MAGQAQALRTVNPVFGREEDIIMRELTVCYEKAMDRLKCTEEDDFEDVWLLRHRWLSLQDRVGFQDRMCPLERVLHVLFIASSRLSLLFEE